MFRLPFLNLAWKTNEIVAELKKKFEESVSEVVELNVALKKYRYHNKSEATSYELKTALKDEAGKKELEVAEQMEIDKKLFQI